MISRIDQIRFVAPFWSSSIHASWTSTMSKIYVYHEFLKQYFLEYPEDVREIQQYLFLMDVFQTEGITVPKEQIDSFDEFLMELCSGIQVAPLTPSQEKAYHLYQAFRYIQNLPSTTLFDENLAKSIHMMICGPLTSTIPGEYRHCHVEPLGEHNSNLYAHPTAISSRMRDLFDKVQYYLKVYHTLSDRIRLASWF